MGAAEVQLRGPDDAKVSARSRFEGYKSGNRRPNRAAEVTEDKTLRQFKQILENLPPIPDVESCEDDEELELVKEYYGKVLDMVRPLQYAPQDIESFSLALHSSLGEEGLIQSGILLSALINNSKVVFSAAGCTGKDFIIHTSHIEGGIPNIGFMNTKNITIDGFGGNNLGILMRHGTITVNGNCGWNPGSLMQGGKIWVNGDAGDRIGDSMKGGVIAIQGNGGDVIGHCMEGGEIHIRDNVGFDLGNLMKGGCIDVGGNASFSVGRKMSNGFIRVEGNAEAALEEGIGDGYITIYGAGSYKVENGSIGPYRLYSDFSGYCRIHNIWVDGKEGTISFRRVEW